MNARSDARTSWLKRLRPLPQRTSIGGPVKKPKPGAKAVYWEKQRGEACALHAMNMLLGGGIFSETDLDAMGARKDDECGAGADTHWGQSTPPPPVGHD